MKRRFIVILLHCYIVILLLLGTACQQRTPLLYKNTRLMMGTIVEVISPDKRAAGIVFKEIGRIESLLSYYKQNSEISRLNKQGRLQLSPESLFVIKKAGEFWQETKGAFDITIAPLIKLWGFYDRDYRVPKDFEIDQKMSLIGFDKLRIDDNIIEFKIKGTEIDLGGIAKGFAVDCAINKLRLAGIKSALLNAGGDIYCLGDRQGLPWRIGIRAGEDSGSAGYLELKDKAVATSGNYEQHFFVDGRRYCHILNPKTGSPADSGIASVTVIADDCLTADVLATSIFIMGKQKVQGLAKRFNAEVKIYTDVRNN